MGSYSDALEVFRQQQNEMKKILNSPAIQSIQDLNDMMRFTALDVIKEQDTLLRQIADIKVFDTDISKNFSAFSYLPQDYTLWYEKSSLWDSFNHINSTVTQLANAFSTNAQGLVNDLTKSINTLQLGSLFDDITIDTLSVFNDFLEDYNNVDFQQIATDISYESTLLDVDVDANKTGSMTREELRLEIVSAIQSAQSGITKEMRPAERLKSFITDVMQSIGQDLAKWVVMLLILLMAQYFSKIIAGNHDYEIGKQISEKIGETELVSSVKKVFSKNHEIEKPLGDMAFLRTDSHLRTRPNKQSHLVSKDAVSRNTVVFPIEKKGNWILVEVETKNHFVIGWVQESKVIKFKVD
ncbi:hypothetical protein [Niallia sp. FSL R7-0271]|uniref:hypothetical protein n=1 Tax=Niallia sp. FSL R7-0271 TaxID=2921678 RepID=UPI0030F7C363